MQRVARINDDPYFLARVTRVALYGSMLRPEVKRLSDVDLAVQLVAKETDFDRLREANAERVEQLAIMGRCSSNFVEEQFCWFLETFRFLKGRSRVISLADYNIEKRLVLAVPHRMLLGEPDKLPPETGPNTPQPTPRTRRSAALRQATETDSGRSIVVGLVPVTGDILFLRPPQGGFQRDCQTDPLPIASRREGAG